MQRYAVLIHDSIMKN